jgi:predicted alpha/beta hydrolase
MEDGPLSRMLISERRERLKAHIKAWTDAQWSSYIHLLDMDRNTFVMDVAVGGILTFISRKEGKMKFVQLPSNSRGIAMRQWEHSLPFIPAKYALDPSEDVLIVLEHEE